MFIGDLDLVNSWMNFDQTCTDIYLGPDSQKEWLDFDDLDLIFKVTRFILLYKRVGIAFACT